MIYCYLNNIYKKKKIFCLNRIIDGLYSFKKKK